LLWGRSLVGEKLPLLQQSSPSLFQKLLWMHRAFGDSDVGQALRQVSGWSEPVDMVRKSIELGRGTYLVPLRVWRHLELILS
jgi:hypothetical protein